MSEDMDLQQNDEIFITGSDGVDVILKGQFGLLEDNKIDTNNFTTLEGEKYNKDESGNWSKVSGGGRKRRSLRKLGNSIRKMSRKMKKMMRWGGKKAGRKSRKAGRKSRSSRK